MGMDDVDYVGGMVAPEDSVDACGWWKVEDETWSSDGGS